MLQVPVNGRSLIAKVADGLDLAGEDRSWFLDACSDAQRVGRHVDLAREGSPANDIHVIVRGFAVRYGTEAEGREQNFGFIIPGDFCDLHAALLPRHDHSIKTLSPCLVATIPRQIVLDAAARSRQLTKAFWWCALLNEAILREWIVNLGAKPAEQRVAHLFCELHARLDSVGLVQPDNSFLLPMSQGDLANTVGISHVHVNRSLKALRDDGLMHFHKGVVCIADLERLKSRAAFDPGYLHLDTSPEGRG